MSAANGNLAGAWAKELGLIEAPLFSAYHDSFGTHSVLLNGGRGSFALTTQGDEELSLDEVASWVWSADLSHHVYIRDDKVTLSRWDDPTSTRVFSRPSVERSKDPFYELLRLDRVRSRVDIVEHSIDVFRRIRSYVNEQRLQDDASIHLFLFLIASLLSMKEQQDDANAEYLSHKYALDQNYIPAFEGLGSYRLSAFVDQFRSYPTAFRTLQLEPQLLVRHAAGTVFQEAHFEFIRGNPTDLFGLPGKAEVRIDTRGGTHFTPPGLARAVVEQSFKEVRLLDNLVVFDPACGAGSFLHEAIRFLQRARYAGTLRLVGYDASQNAAAMARFVLNEARRDWPEGRVESIQIEVCDSLDPLRTWPDADVLLMNPPFISWTGLDRSQRECVKQLLGKLYTGRPDFSMAFIERAVSSLRAGAVIGTLLPSSILSLEASLKWRRHLLDRATPKFIAVLGDHALFRHAIVEVACAVFVKEPNPDLNAHYVSVWSNERRGASGEALRNLRRLTGAPQEDIQHGSEYKSGDVWRVSMISTALLAEGADWRPRPQRLDHILPDILKSCSTRVSDLFHIRQGIRAGLREVFIISETAYDKLKAQERRFFRRVAENRNIRSGRIQSHQYIFYPDTSGLDKIETESDLKSLLPTYFTKYLEPNRERLVERKGLKPLDWWSPTRPRTYFAKRQVKIVTSYFGDAGSFALDTSGDFVVVQGFAWFTQPKVRAELESIPLQGREDYRSQILLAYLALLNSRVFSLLLAEFCPHVAGGQFNLSKKFVDHIPLPDLVEVGQQGSHWGNIILSLADEGNAIHSSSGGSPDRINEMVAELYHIPLGLWPAA